MSSPETLAAIDVGTNSFHLVVARLLGEGRFSIIAKEKAVVRLGESAAQIKRLTERAMERGVEAMRLFKLVTERTNSPIRAVATSAVREAANREQFIERVYKATNIEIEVISGFEEARLIYLGVLQALPVYDERAALFDIGGGSTEFLVGEQGRVLYANSFKIGAIRMTQRFFPGERVTASQVQDCRSFLQGEIYHAAEEIARSGAPQLIASSGTAQTIAAMALAARGEPIPESLNGITVPLPEISTVVQQILRARNNAERAALPGVDPRRADILAAGAVTLETIVEACSAEGITISSYALREGIILDTIQKLDQPGRGLTHLSDLRYESVIRIGRLYNFDEAHGRHVADLALLLFNALAPLHGLPEGARELLEAAAFLHDVGYHISHAAHHKHSHYLIRNSEIYGFNEEEIAMIALVARYHRKSHPKVHHPEFAALRFSDATQVRVLAALLRVADGLDRTHRGNVRGVEVRYNDRTITVEALHPLNCAIDYELWSASRKQGLMEEVFDRKVAIRAEAGAKATA